MNTAIIITLVILILIIGISIVIVLIKSKKEDKGEEIPSKTFQDSTVQEPQVFTPQLQKQEPPVMQDLSTPQAVVAPSPETPVAPIENGITQNKELFNQSSPLPDSTQITQDLETLNPVPTPPAPELGSAQANTPPSPEKVDDDMQSIMDALNTPESSTPVADVNPPVMKQTPVIPNVQTPMPEPTPPVVNISQPVIETPTPDVDNNPIVEQVPYVADINTRKPVPPVVDVTQPVVTETPTMPNINTQTPVPPVVDVTQPVVTEAPTMPNINTQTPVPPVVDVTQPVVEEAPTMPSMNTPPIPTTPVGI